MSDDLTLDANAIGGVLLEIFGTEMTGLVCECAHCHNHAAVGTLRAYVHGPGTVLRCSTCDGVMIRIAPTRAGGYRIDISGAAGLELPPG